MEGLTIRTKRVYDPPSSEDGRRVLVDRLWPRGLTRDRVQAVWMKELAPSEGLRRWFNHAPERFPAFAQKYRQELLRGDGSALVELARLAGQGTLTLLYGARDPRHNQAAVLAGILQELLVPPPKTEVRRKVRAWRDSLAPEEVALRSRQVQESLAGTEEFRRAGRLLLYLSVGSEVQTGLLLTRALAEGKRVFAPRVEPSARRLLIGEVRDPARDLEPGPFQQIPQPKEALPLLAFREPFDLVLVPGIAFDRFGNRIGYGGGYYDGLLRDLPRQTRCLGLLFTGQLVPRCPGGSGDRPVHGLVCEDGVLPLWPPLG